MITEEEIAAIRRGIAAGKDDYDLLYKFYTGTLPLETDDDYRMYTAFLNAGAPRVEFGFDGVAPDPLEELEGRARKRTLCSEVHRLEKVLA
jgi:hypothetical protein